MKWNEKYSTELSCLDMIYVVATTGRIDASLLCNDLDQWTVRLVFWYAVKRPSRLALVSKEDRPPCPQHIPSRTREMQGNSYCVVLLSITKQKKKGRRRKMRMPFTVLSRVREWQSRGNLFSKLLERLDVVCWAFGRGVEHANAL